MANAMSRHTLMATCAVIVVIVATAMAIATAMVVDISIAMALGLIRLEMFLSFGEYRCSICCCDSLKNKKPWAPSG